MSHTIEQLISLYNVFCEERYAQACEQYRKRRAVYDAWRNSPETAAAQLEYETRLEEYKQAYYACMDYLKAHATDRRSQMKLTLDANMDKVSMFARRAPLPPADYMLYSETEWAEYNALCEAQAQAAKRVPMRERELEPPSVGDKPAPVRTVSEFEDAVSHDIAAEAFAEYAQAHGFSSAEISYEYGHLGGADMLHISVENYSECLEVEW